MVKWGHRVLIAPQTSSLRRSESVTSPSLFYREIPLSQGQVALVDAHNFERINAHKWIACWNKDIRGFYAKRVLKVDGKTLNIWMHREILGLHAGDKRQGEHREPSRTLDNRECNLRIATNTQNAHNKRVQSNSVSGLKGVSFDSSRLSKWSARIKVNGRCVNLGWFHTPEEAHKRYCEAAAEHFGEFARFA